MFRARTQVLGVVSVLTLAGCSAMRPVHMSYLSTDQPKVVQITRTDGSRVTLVGARIMGDTLTGFALHPDRPVGEYEEMPLTDVKMLEAEQYTWWRTTGVIGAGLVAWGALTWFVIYEVEKEPTCRGIGC